MAIELEIRGKAAEIIGAVPAPMRDLCRQIYWLGHTEGIAGIASVAVADAKRSADKVESIVAESMAKMSRAEGST